MKRLVASLVFGTVAALALAQAPFTIVRPVDGAKVRETVVIQVPKASIPEGAYVGVFLNGKFVEATILDLKGRYYEYRLNTKDRNIADGNYKLELVLYGEAGGAPRVIDRSSVDITIANRAVTVPANGLLLRYKYRPGTEYYYNMDQKVQVSTISEAQARLGGRASVLDVEGESYRFKYAVDNAYGNGDGLIRLQPLPERGKDYAIITTANSSGPTKYMDFEMHPLYMRLTSTGREVWGSVPLYVPIAGSAPEATRTDLFLVAPLPTLPDKRVRPGSVWQTRFQWGSLNLEDLYGMSSLVTKSLARGELLSVEWEMGHPCAKIRHSIAAGQAAPNMQVRGGLGANRISVEETFWFALDLGVVVKAISDITLDERVSVNPGGATPGGSAGNPGGNPDQLAPRRPGPPGAGGGRMNTPPPGSLLQGAGSLDDGGPPRGGQRGGNPGLGGQGRQGGPQVGVLRFNRTRIQYVMTLQQ